VSRLRSRTPSCARSCSHPLARSRFSSVLLTDFLKRLLSFEEVSCILVLAATILRLLLSTRHILEVVPVVVRFLFLEVFRGLVDSKVFFVFSRVCCGCGCV
jgi:hypothetical protein